MARPRVAAGGDGLQIWREAANLLNKHLPTDNNGWSSTLGIGRRLTTLHSERKHSVTKCYIGSHPYRRYKIMIFYILFNLQVFRSEAGS
jgi:hypothetical protein